MKRTMEFVSDTVEGRNKARRSKYESPLIKWFQTSGNPEDTLEIDSDKNDKFEALGLKKIEKDDGKNHTFWENDGGDRENLSNDAYDDFLAQNNIDVSNMNAVDISAILGEAEAENMDQVDDYSEADSFSAETGFEGGFETDGFSTEAGFETGFETDSFLNEGGFETGFEADSFSNEGGFEAESDTNETLDYIPEE